MRRAMAATLNVSIVDDETKRHPTLKAKWDTIVQLAGFRSNSRCTSDFDNHEGVFSGRPHLVIVDNVLIESSGGSIRTTKEKVNRGIDFVAAHKRNYQDTVFILSTAEPFSIEVLGSKFPNPDLVLPKSGLSSTVFQTEIGQTVRRLVRRAPFGDQFFPSSKDGDATKLIRDEIRSIVEQCIFPLSGMPSQPYFEQVNLIGLGGGYSGAFVFRVEMFSDGYRKGIPMVLKITEGRSSQNEARNYNSYARLHLPNEMRVDLIGTGAAGNYSGALYAFAFGGAEGIDSASAYIRAGRYEVIEDIVSKVFSSAASGWYRDPVSRTNAEVFFNNSEEYSREKDDRRLASTNSYAQSLLGGAEVETSLDRLRVSGFSSKFVRRNLQKFEEVLVPEAIGHGDFNTNNIIFSPDRKLATLIDFEYCGYDYVFKDFVSLECSLRVDERQLTGGNAKEFDNCVRAELHLLEKDDVSRLPKNCVHYSDYLSRIHAVRLAAKIMADKLSIDFDRRLYNLALSFHLLKLLGIPGWPATNSFLVLSAYVACSEWLEKQT
jgi:Phosphotransferase enzyme family